MPSTESEKSIVFAHSESVTTRHRRTLIGVLLASAATLMLVLSACTGPLMANLNADEARVPLPSSAPTESVPVYYLGSQDNKERLYREYRETRSMEDPIATAVSAMATLAPLDPTYQSFWRPASKITASLQNQNITLDLSKDAFRTGQKLSKREAEQSVQQLIHTATAAAAQADLADGLVSVTILVDGRPNYEAWGQIVLGRPMERKADARAPIWLTEPRQDQRIESGVVSIAGSASSARSKVYWEVSGPDDAVVRSGSLAVSDSPSAPGNFDFTVDLPVGRYTISMFDLDLPEGAPDPDLAEGSGRRVFVDRKDFTVEPTKTH
jgi:hypothetical protein